MLRTDDLRDAAVQRFGIGSVADCRLQKSFINDTYRLEAGERIWFLRVTPSMWRTVSEVEVEIDFVRALGATGAPVIEPVPLTDGSGFVLELVAPEGPRAAALFAGATGAEPPFTSNPDALAIARRYGRVSARLHALADGLPAIVGRPPMDLDAMLRRPLAIVAAQLEQTEARDDLARIGERLTTALISAPSGRGRQKVDPAIQVPEGEI